MVTISDINLSLRTGVLTLDTEEVDDLTDCLDILIAKEINAPQVLVIDSRDYNSDDDNWSSKGR